MIACSGLDVTIDGVPILTDVTVSVSARHVAVIGENGSGKSTFARVLGGLIPPTSGHAHVAGADVRHTRALRRVVGMVFQNPDAQLLMPTPLDDVALSLRAERMPRTRRTERAMDELRRVHLDARAHDSAATLSGGQKQLLALAGALVRRPRVLLADEPTTLLDLPHARRVSQLLLDAPTDQTLIVTHDLALARRCEMALRFCRGRLVGVGEAAAIVDDYVTDHS